MPFILFIDGELRSKIVPEEKEALLSLCNSGFFGKDPRYTEVDVGSYEDDWIINRRTKEVADIIRAYGGRMVSILTSYDGVSDGFRKLYIRMHSIERSQLLELQEELIKVAGLIYMVDHCENERKIY